MLRVIVKKRDLLRELVARSLSEANKSSALPFLWIILNPLALVVMYMVVFVTLANARLGIPADSRDFAAYMLLGLSAWLGIQQGVSSGSSSLVANAQLVKQVVFSIELLPVRHVFAALVPELIGFFAVTIYMAVKFHFVSPLLPLTIFGLMIQVFMVSGIALMLAPVVAIVRDVQNMIGIFVMAGIFLLPIPFPPGTLPGWFDVIYWLNPLAHIIWMFQDALYYGTFMHPWSWVMGPLSGIALFEMGARLFERTRDHIGDVL